jgi:hypothetical protein
MQNLKAWSRSAVTPPATVGARPGTSIAGDVTVLPAHEAVARLDQHRLERLIDRLPNALQPSTRWLRRPSSRWVRIPAGALLIGGGVLSILPFLGIWMLPLGLMLLAEDMPPLRRSRGRVLDWIARHRPHWLAESKAVTATPALPLPRSWNSLPGVSSPGSDT